MGGAVLCTLHGALATDQSARRTGVGHEREHGEMGKRCRPGERRGEGERQMDRGVREAAGYRQGRNCVSGACCQKYVSIVQIGEKKEGEGGQKHGAMYCRNGRRVREGLESQL